MLMNELGGAPLSTLIPVPVTGIQQRRVHGAEDSPFPRYRQMEGDLHARFHHKDLRENRPNGQESFRRADARRLDSCDRHRNEGG